MEWQKSDSLRILNRKDSGAKSAVVLFHGYGADASDLYSLSDMYRFDKPTDWYFPQGVLEVPIGPMMSGRAWFELTVKDFEDLAKNSYGAAPIPPQAEQTMAEVCHWLNDLPEQYEEIVIGGFSQGAILSSHCSYRLEFAPKAFLLFSGYAVSLSSFQTLPEALKVPFFQSHGEQDQVLPIAGARKLYDHLESLGLKGRWTSFPGGHEIPLQVIQRSQTFLDSL